MKAAIHTRMIVQTAIAALAGASVSVSAHAQQDTAAPPRTAVLEEIVVTARKREETSQSVPISMSVFSGAALEDRGVTDLADVAKFTPNMSFDVGSRSIGGSSTGTLFIRGIGQTDFQPTADPGVGLYVDGIYVGRSAGSVLDVVDVERIEVLRGPQGTLFGKNTVGGAISIVSARPRSESNGYVEVAIGRFDQRDVKAGLDIPLVEDRLAVRLSAASRARDGYAESLSDGRQFGDIDSNAVRAVVSATLSERADLTVIGDWSRRREHGQFQRPTGIDISQAGGGLTLFNALVASRGPYQRYDSRWNPPSTYTNFSTGPNVSDVESWGVSADLKIELTPQITFESISAYRRLDSDTGGDADGSPLDLSSTRLLDEQRQFSQELRLGGSAFGDRLSWLIGGYYFDERITDYNQTRILSGLYAALEALPFRIGPLGGAGNPANISLDVDIDQYLYPKNESWAIFTQESYRLTDRLSLTAGMRFNREHKTIDAVSTRVNAGVYILPPGTRLEREWDSWTPKVSLEFQATADALLYLSYARGFKAGGFNPRPQTVAEFAAYDPEEVATYETGFKTDWLARRLRLNGAVFYSRYEDLQLYYNVPAGVQDCPSNQGSGCFITNNAARVDITGAELELTARPIPDFDLSAGIGYIHNEFKEIDPILLSQGFIDFDSQIPKTPEWSANVAAEYRVPLAGWGHLRLYGDYSYKTKVYQDFENAESIAQPGFGLVNAAISLRPASERWDLSLTGKNLTDEVYVTSGIESPGFGFSLAGLGEPRTWSLSLRYRFGAY